MVTVQSDGDFLIYMRDGVEIYDPAIPAPAEIGRFFRHMMSKTWFTPDMKAETMRLVREYYGGEE